MSHGDAVVAAPDGFDVLASTADTPVAAFEDLDRAPRGRAVAPRGAAHRARPAGARATSCSRSPAAGRPGRWSTSSRSRSSKIRAQIGDRRAICGLSGGVDSAVAAALVQRAIGDQLTCVFVDHGLLRKGEAEQVERDYVAATGVSLHVVDAEKRFLDALAGVRRPRGEAQDHRPRVHPGLRGRRGRDRRRRRRAGRARSSSWSRARSTPTSWSPAAAPAPPTSSPTTTSAGCPTTSSSSSSSRCAPCSRTRSALVGEQLGLPAGDRLAAPVPRPGPRHPDHRRGHPRPAGDPPRGGRHRPRGAHPRRPGPRHLAVPGGAARRRALGRRPGRRPHLRPPGRAAPGHLRGRDDRRLGAAPVRRHRDASPRGSPTRSARSTGWRST